MHILDASAIVHGWDNYRVDKFPRLWEWLEGEMHQGNLNISAIALAEVAHVSPDCHAWLNGKIQIQQINAAMLATTLAYKRALGIDGENYNTHGVDENDLFIVSCAQQLGMSLISNEAVQIALPQSMARYKIPAVCQHIARIDCCDFKAYINSSSAIF